MITGMTVLSELKARICTEGNPRLSRPMIEADLKVVGHAAVRRMACLDAATEMERSTREDLILDTRLDVSTKNLQQANLHEKFGKFAEKKYIAMTSSAMSTGDKIEQARALVDQANFRLSSLTMPILTLTFVSLLKLESLGKHKEAAALKQMISMTSLVHEDNKKEKAVEAPVDRAEVAARNKQIEDAKTLAAQVPLTP